MNAFGVVMCCLASAGGGVAAAELFGKRISAAAERGAKETRAALLTMEFGLRSKISEQTERMHKRFDGLGGKVDGLHGKVDEIKAGGGVAVEQSIGTVKVDVEGIGKAVEQAIARAVPRI